MIKEDEQVQQTHTKEQSRASATQHEQIPEDTNNNDNFLELATSDIG